MAPPTPMSIWETKTGLRGLFLKKEEEERKNRIEEEEEGEDKREGKD